MKMIIIFMQVLPAKIRGTRWTSLEHILKAVHFLTSSLGHIAVHKLRARDEGPRHA
jgi:hypothetical protein